MATRSRRGADKTLAALKWLVVGLLLAYVASLFLGKLNIDLPFRLYVVQSGSMEPSIMTGDVIFIRPDITYTQNQVITFIDREGRTITHRIVEIKQLGRDRSVDEVGDNSAHQPAIFITKGDANPDSDSEEVGISQILGRVVLVLPKIGYLIAFAKTRWGSLLFVIVPAVLIVYDEYRDMKRKL